MPIIINSKKEGFRRAGVSHPAIPKEYPDGFFTKQQLTQLKAEPMLMVQEIKAEPEGGAQDDKQPKGSGPKGGK